MAVEVPCPSCRSVLRAPDEAAGKRVRCKKCDYRFRIPGGDPLADSGGESQLLSVVDVPALPARPAAAPPADPFAFDPGPPPDDEDEVDDEDEEERPRRRAKGGNLAVVLVVVGVVAFLAVGAVGAAAYYLVVKTVPAIAATATSASVPAATRPTTAEPPAPAPVEPPTRATPTRRDRAAPKGKDAGPSPKGGPPTAVAALTLPAAPTKTAVVARPKVRIETDSPPAAVRGIRFAEGNPATVGVLWKSFAGFQGSGAKDTLDLFSATTGRRIDRLELVADGLGDGRQFDLSQDGKFVAVEHAAGRVTVIDTETKKKPLDLIDPFEGGLIGTVAGLRFLTADKLLAFDRAGGLALWDVKEKKRLAYGRPVGPTGAAPVVAVSEVCGDRVFVGVPGGLQAVGVGTGEPIGPPTPLPNPEWVPVAVAADPAGKQAAVAYRNPGATPPYGLAILPISGGRGVTANVVLPEAAGVPVGVAMPTDLVVAVTTDKAAAAVVYDLENVATAAYVRSPGPAAFQAAQPGGAQHWWVVADPKDDKKAVVVGVEMPFDGYFGVVNEAKADRKPAWLVPQPDGLGK